MEITSLNRYIHWLIRNYLQNLFLHESHNVEQRKLLDYEH